MYKIATSRLPELFSLISASEALYMPMDKDGLATFDLWTAEGTTALDKLNTVKSAKDMFFPQSEDMAAFKVDGQNITIKEGSYVDEKFVVFGVRACDAKSFEILDRVFLSDPVDNYYQARREHGTVVTMACGEPDDTCFCSAFGIDATNPGGDVAAWTVGETLYWKSLTEKGEALTELVKGLFEEAGAEDDAAVEAYKAEAKAIIEKLPNAVLNLEGFDEEHLMEKFNAPEWEELYKGCLACGTCTYVCPTCQCYDIRDYDTGHGIQRFRCWDSCMFSDFTLMAHGNNRNSQLERFRQRFMHKLVYFPANNEGIYGCVGCGRCVAKCPISMNIVKVIKALGVK